jgi:hypothetical protein
MPRRMPRPLFALFSIGGLLLATALPFLPGGYDGLAVPLSAMARGFGLLSLLLVPVGVAWWLAAKKSTGAGRRGRAWPVVATLVAGSIAALAAAAMAVQSSGATLALGACACWSWLAYRFGRRRLTDPGSEGSDRGVAALLVAVPLVVVGAQLALAEPLTSFARRRAIDGVEPLIADIERYRAANGEYPRSLLAEWMDYRPPVIGVAGYQYGATDNAYVLAVEVPTFSLTAREFLVYDPTDAHVMPSHDAHCLLPTASERALYRGYYSATPLDQAHWKVLLFD